jgi:hypothetical protein
MGPKIDSWAAALVIAVVFGVLYYLLGWHIYWMAPTIAVGGFVCVLGIQVFGFLLIGNSARSRRLRVLESNYGRAFGWYVEMDGRRVAELSDPLFVDMFLESYRIEALVVEEKERMLTDIQWWSPEKLVFRNREFGEVAENAFAGGTLDDGRITMRGLYLCEKEPNMWESLVLWWRRKFVQSLTHCKWSRP